MDDGYDDEVDRYEIKKKKLSVGKNGKIEAVDLPM